MFLINFINNYLKLVAFSWSYLNSKGETKGVVILFETHCIYKLMISLFCDFIGNLMPRQQRHLSSVL